MYRGESRHITLYWHLVGLSNGGRNDALRVDRSNHKLCSKNDHLLLDSGHQELLSLYVAQPASCLTLVKPDWERSKQTSGKMNGQDGFSLQTHQHAHPQTHILSHTRLRRLTFTRWECYGYVKDIKQPSLPSPFWSILEYISVFMALSTVFHSINSPHNSPFSHSVLPVLSLPQ